MADGASLLDEELSSFVFNYLTESSGSQVRGTRAGTAGSRLGAPRRAVLMALHAQSCDQFAHLTWGLKEKLLAGYRRLFNGDYGNCKAIGPLNQAPVLGPVTATLLQGAPHTSAPDTLLRVPAAGHVGAAAASQFVRRVLSCMPG